MRAGGSDAIPRAFLATAHAILRDTLRKQQGTSRQADPLRSLVGVSGHPSTYIFVLLSFMVRALEIATGTTASTAAL
jgi:hypothetical protein